MANSNDRQVSRRRMLMGAAAGSAVLTAAPSSTQAQATRPTVSPATADASHMSKVAFTVNGTLRELELDTRSTLLDALRERLFLSGSKKGCDQGQCGACTVLVEGRRVAPCLTLAAMHDGDSITT